MGEVWAVDAIALNFLKKIRLYWIFHVGFVEIRFLKWHDLINSNSWFFGNIKRVFRFDFIQANI